MAKKANTSRRKDSAQPQQSFFDIRAGIPNKRFQETEELQRFNDDVNITIAAIGDVPISRLFEMRLLEAFFLARERIISAVPHLNLKLFRMGEDEIIETFEPVLRAAKKCPLKVRDMFVLPRMRLPSDLVTAIIGLHKAGLPSFKPWANEDDEMVMAARDYFIDHFINTLPEVTMRQTWELPKYGVPQKVYGLLSLAVLLGICTKPKANGLICNLRHFPGSGLPACKAPADNNPHWCAAFPVFPDNPDPNCSLKSY